jgi:hypothetical protein
LAIALKLKKHEFSRSHAPHGNAFWMRRIQVPSRLYLMFATVCNAGRGGAHAAHGNEENQIEKEPAHGTNTTFSEIKGIQSYASAGIWH